MRVMENCYFIILMEILLFISVHYSSIDLMLGMSEKHDKLAHVLIRVLPGT